MIARSSAMPASRSPFPVPLPSRRRSRTSQEDPSAQIALRGLLKKTGLECSAASSGAMEEYRAPRVLHTGYLKKSGMRRRTRKSPMSRAEIRSRLLHGTRQHSAPPVMVSRGRRGYGDIRTPRASSVTSKKRGRTAPDPSAQEKGQ